MNSTRMNHRHLCHEVVRRRPSPLETMRGAAALTVASVFLLTGCASAPAAPSTALVSAKANLGEVAAVDGAGTDQLQTFTNPTVDAPATAELAVADATAALTQYRLLYDYILTHEGAGSAQIQTFVTTDASSEVDGTAAALASGTMTASGTQSFHVLQAIAGENVVGESTLPLQAVGITACYDNSVLKLVVDGTAVSLPAMEKVDIVLTFETDANNWRISFIQPYPNAEECS